MNVWVEDCSQTEHAHVTSIQIKKHKAPPAVANLPQGATTILVSIPIHEMSYFITLYKWSHTVYTLSCLAFFVPQFYVWNSSMMFSVLVVTSFSLLYTNNFLKICGMRSMKFIETYLTIFQWGSVTQKYFSGEHQSEFVVVFWVKC